jgi:hypothetical protein
MRVRRRDAICLVLLLVVYCISFCWVQRVGRKKGHLEKGSEEGGGKDGWIKGGRGGSKKKVGGKRGLRGEGRGEKKGGRNYNSKEVRE